jgi:hypothetical protein
MAYKQRPHVYTGHYFFDGSCNGFDCILQMSIPRENHREKSWNKNCFATNVRDETFPLPNILQQQQQQQHQQQQTTTRSCGKI